MMSDGGYMTVSDSMGNRRNVYSKYPSQMAQGFAPGINEESEAARSMNMNILFSALPDTLRGPDDDSYHGKVPARARMAHPEAARSIMQISGRQTASSTRRSCGRPMPSFLHSSQNGALKTLEVFRPRLRLLDGPRYYAHPATSAAQVRRADRATGQVRMVLPSQRPRRGQDRKLAF